MRRKDPAEKAVRDIRRKTRRRYSAEEKIRIVLEGLRGEESIAVLCRHEGIAESLYYSWSKEFLEAGKKRLAGDAAPWTTPLGRAMLTKYATDQALRHLQLTTNLINTGSTTRGA